MKTKLIMLFILSILFLSCASSIESVRDGKESGESVVYKTTFENAWAYVKKIFKEEGVTIKEINKDQGSIFGEQSATLVNYGSYIGVWIDEVNDNEVNVIAYSKRALATQLASGFSASDLHEKLKVYVDAE
ncbi:MAG: hypothetical protein KAV45_14275 [Calditrichia bacterium]|nr:hypothetical protein [Calditrichia bacterium]